MKKILCIIRASTEQQETDSQKKELVEFLLHRGFLEEEMLFIEVQGASAVKCNRKYLDFISKIKTTILQNPTVKNAACWHLNRLGRIESKLHELKDFFVANRIQLYVKNPSITLLDENGTLNPAAGIAFSVYASMVKFETDEMFSKMHRGRMRNKENNLFIGGQVKFGYKKLPDMRLVLHPEDSNMIKLLFELYSTGNYSIRSLIKEMNERGYKRSEGDLTYPLIRRLLNDRAYVDGYLGVDGFISEKIFLKCKDILSGASKKFKTKETKRVNFCVGVLHCFCGCNYIAATNYYTCFHNTVSYKQTAAYPKVCNSPSIRRDVIDPIVIDMAQYLEIKRSYLSKETTIEEISSVIDILKQKYQTLETSIQQQVDKLEKLQESYFVDGKLSDKQFKMLSEKIENNTVKFESELSSIKLELDGKIREKQAIEQAIPLSYNLVNLSKNLGNMPFSEHNKIKNIVNLNIADVRFTVEKQGRNHNVILKTTKNEVFEFVYSVNNRNFKKGPYIFVRAEEKDIPMYTDDMYITREALEYIQKRIGI